MKFAGMVLFRSMKSVTIQIQVMLMVVILIVLLSSVETVKSSQVNSVTMVMSAIMTVAVQLAKMKYAVME